MLRLKWLIILFGVVFFPSYGKKPPISIDFAPIIEHAKNIKLERNSIENLSQQITYPYSTKEEKMAAIYTWVAIHVTYDIKRIQSFRTYNSEAEVLNYVAATNKGVCLHYCIYFDEICKFAGIESHTISGYVRQNGQIKQTPHTWNAVNLNDQWYLCDITWAAGYVKENTFHKKFSPDFFMVMPKKFIATHMPFDKMWQLISYPYTFDEFAMGSRHSDSTYFNYKDTLQAFELASDCEKLIRERDRMAHNGTIPLVVSNELHYKNQNIEVCLHNQQATKINDGITFYDEAVQQYNRYINLYNHQFQSPKISDDELRQITRQLQQTISSAKYVYDSVHITNPEINEAVQLNRESLNKLEQQVDREINFINNYLNTPKEKRKALFYQRKFM